MRSCAKKKNDEDSIEARLVKTLAKPTTVEFLDLPLEDCLAFLKEFHKVNIVINHPALIEEGIARDHPINLKLADVSFESILHLILEPLQLDWVIQDEVLKITTAFSAAQHAETRPYAVQNLIEAGHTSEELMASITKCIEPESWFGKDATAGISHSGGRTQSSGNRSALTAKSPTCSWILDEIAAEEEENGDKEAKKRRRFGKNLPDRTTAGRTGRRMREGFRRCGYLAASGRRRQDSRREGSLGGRKYRGRPSIGPAVSRTNCPPIVGRLVTGRVRGGAACRRGRFDRSLRRLEARPVRRWQRSEQGTLM